MIIMSSNVCCIALFIASLLIPFVNSVSFQISRFGPDVIDILYEGDAVASVGEVEFNKANYLCRVAHAIYREKVPLWDPDHDSTKLADFSTRFSFTIDTQNRSSYGHGIAFFLAPVGFRIPPNSDGGFLGLFNTTTSDSAQSQIVSVEFDTFSNVEWDPPFEHVGINNNSIASSVTAPWNVSLHSGNPIETWITYNATTNNLSVIWNYGTGPNSSMFYIINLRDVLPPWVTIGFSAATGLNVERHTLESWEFSSSLVITELGGNDREKIGLIAGLTTLGGILLVSAILALIVLRKRRRKVKGNPETISLTSFNDDLEKGAGPRKFFV